MRNLSSPCLVGLAICVLSVTSFGQSTWTGSQNNDWDNANNWSPAGVPTSGTDVIVASAANQPSSYLVGPECNDLTIQSGATLTLGSGFDLEVNGDLTIDGTLTISSSSSEIAVAGGFINNGTFTHGSSMVELTGTGSVGGSSAVTFNELVISGGTRTATAGCTVLGDITVEGGSAFNISNATHSIGGNWVSSAPGVTVTGTGTIQFTGSGLLTTGANSVPNVSITGGTRSVNACTVTGNLTMTAGALQILDNATLTVNGNASLIGGTIGWTSSFAGLETLHVDGNIICTATAGGTSADVRVHCGGDYTSGGGFAPTAGTWILDGGTTATVTGLGTSFPNLQVLSGTKTINTPINISGDLEVSSGATLDTDAALDINGNVQLGNGTAEWDLGSSTHTVAGNFASGNADASGTGTVEFDGTGILLTGSGSVANILVSGGARTLFNSTIAGNYTQTGGSSIFANDQKVDVGGNVAITGGSVTWPATAVGIPEGFDVDGDVTVNVAVTAESADMRIFCGGDWSSTAAFAPVFGLIQMDGAGPNTLGGTTPNLPNLTILAGTITVTDPVAIAGSVVVASGAGLDTDAALDIEGNVTIGNATSSWDMGASTHTIGGDYISSGADATGAGTLEFDGPGFLTTASGSVSNVVITTGARSVTGSTVTGDLTMNAGSITIGDNQTLSVGGNCTLNAGTLNFFDNTGGFEVLDVGGNCTITATAGTTNFSTRINCGGNWLSTAAFAPTGGACFLDAPGVASISGAGINLNNLFVDSGIYTLLDALSVNRLEISSGASLLTNAAVTCSGNVVLGNGTASWDMGGQVHLVSGDFTSSGADATNGFVAFDAAGTLNTGSAEVDNVVISSGTRTVQTSAVTTDLAMTAGQLLIADNQTLSVGNNASLSGGILSFDDTSAGSEILDIGGNATVTATAGPTSANTIIRCAGDWSSSSAFAPADGVCQLDGLGANTVSGANPNFHDLDIVAGTKNVTSALVNIAGDLSVGATATLDTDGILDVDGDVSLGSSSTWALGAATHTVAGSYTSTGGSATETGEIEFDGPGSLTTSTGAIANVAVTSGARTVSQTNVTGDLTMTGGSINIQDNQTVAVGGNAALAAGTLTFTNITPGLETLDVEGNVTLTAASGGSHANSRVRCAGDWTSSSAYLPTAGTIIFDGGGPANVSGILPSFFNLTVESGTKTFLDASFVGGNLEIVSGATLDADASLNIDGDVTLGDGTSAFDLGVDTHTVAGSWTSTGGSGTGTGVVEFDDVGGGVLQTAPGSVANVLITTGARLCRGTTIIGDLDVTGGGVTVDDDRKVDVLGNATFDPGTTLSFVGGPFGPLEGLDVEGNLTLNGTIGTESGNSRIFCAGDWVSDSSFSPTDTLVLFDGGTTATISGTGPILPRVQIFDGTKTVLVPTVVVGDLEVLSGATLDTDAALDIGGNVTLGDATAAWDVGTSTHTIEGNYVSAGADATGTGTLAFDGAGTVLDSGGASIPNASVSSGARLVSTSDIAGNLAMTGGSLTIQDNQTLTVGGNANLTAGTLGFDDQSAGNETLDVEGDIILSAASGLSSGSTRIFCAGDWSSNSNFSASGIVELDGVAASNLSGLNPGFDPTFDQLVLSNGTRNAGTNMDIASNLVNIASGAALELGGRTVSLDGTTIQASGRIGVSNGGDLQLGSSSAVVFGTLSLVGLPGQAAAITGGPSTGYELSIFGNLEANYFTFEDMSEDGVTISIAATIAGAPLDLRDGTFARPSSAVDSVLLDISRTSATTFRSVNFEDPLVVGTHNVRSNGPGVVTFTNSIGNLAGEDFDDDPFNFVDWTTSFTQISFFNATPQADQVTLDWTSVAEGDIINYIVRRALNAGGPYSQIAILGATGAGNYQFVDNTTVSGTKYFYHLDEQLSDLSESTLSSDSATPWSSILPSNFFSVGASGTFATIQTAINALAGSSAIVYVEAGTYQPFTIDSLGLGTVRILADGSGPVVIDTSSASVVIQNLTAFDNVEMSDLIIGDPTSTFPGIVVQNCAGAIVLDELTVEADGLTPAIQVDASAQVALQRTTMTGGPGLRADLSSLILVGRGSINDVLVTGNSVVRLAGLTAGASTVDPGSTLTNLPGVMPDLDMPEFVSLGGPFTINLAGAPNGAVFLFLHTNLLWLDLDPAVSWVSLGNFAPGESIFFSLLDPAGNASLPLTYPSDGSLFGIPLVFQAIGATPAAQLRFSNVHSIQGRP